MKYLVALLLFVVSTMCGAHGSSHPSTESNTYTSRGGNCLVYVGSVVINVSHVVDMHISTTYSSSESCIGGRCEDKSLFVKFSLLRGSLSYPIESVEQGRQIISNVVNKCGN